MLLYSTYTELNELVYVLFSIVAQLRHKRVKVFTDSSRSERVENFSGSMEFGVFIPSIGSPYIVTINVPELGN